MNFKKYAGIGAVLCAAFLLLPLLSESSNNITPRSACDYLKYQDLITDSYKSDGMGGYFCITKYKMLDDKSNITYGVEGTQNNVNKLYLILNVYNSSNASMLHEQLVRNAKELSRQALKQDLTEEDIEAIRNGLKTSNKIVNGWNIEVIKNVWNTKQGYDIQFIIKK